VNEHWAIRDHWNTYAYVKTHDELDILYVELKTNGAIIVSEPTVTEYDLGDYMAY
jgi:lactoylglutathione lyase